MIKQIWERLILLYAVRLSLLAMIILIINIVHTIVVNQPIPTKKTVSSAVVESKSVSMEQISKPPIVEVSENAARVVSANTISANITISTNKAEERKKASTSTKKKTIKKAKPQTAMVRVPPSTKNGFKSYMSYKAISNKKSPQYKLQQQAYTNSQGIRMVNDRYCVAIGSHWGIEVGENFNLVLANGTVIPCVKGDAKADKDTDAANIYTKNGCMSEFIVDTSVLLSDVKHSGDVSNVDVMWQSPVVSVIKV